MNGGRKSAVYGSFFVAIKPKSTNSNACINKNIPEYRSILQTAVVRKSMCLAGKVRLPREC
jgi:hypothetical protein